MKIAMVTTYFPVLSETFVLNQIVGLLNRGHEVDIYPLLGRPNRQDRAACAVGDYDLLRRTYYGKQPPKKTLSRRVQALALLLSRHALQPGVVLPTMYRMAAQPRTNMWAVPYALHLPIRKKSYDIVHCQFGTVGAVMCVLQKMGLLSGKFVTTFRGSDISRYVYRHGAQVYAELLEHADLLLTNCDYFRRRIVEIGGASDKVAVLRSGVDLSLFKASSDIETSNGRMRVTTNARLVEKKGVAYAIRGVAQAVREGATLEYVIVGDGPLRGELEALVQSEGIGHCTSFRGELPHGELVHELERTDLFVAPSIRANDGNEDAPINTLKEAMAMKIPVISTLHGGIPELVEHGRSGYLVDERDHAAIAQYILLLANSDELRGNMGAAGRKRVEQEYDIERLNDALVAHYERLLA